MAVRLSIPFKNLIAFTIVIFLIPLQKAENCTIFNNEVLNVRKSDEMRNQHFITYSQIALSAHTYNVINSDKEEGLNSVSLSSYKKKSPGAAFAIGFFPGFFIHGLGHYYIGNKGTGSLLLIMELSSVLIASRDVGTTNGTIDNGELALARAFRFLYLTLFFGSWFYDFIGAPLKAEKLNKEHGYSIFIYPKIDSDYVSLNLALSIK